MTEPAMTGFQPVRNYPKRRLVSGLLAVPLLLLASTLLIFPFAAANPAIASTIQVALPVTIIAELVAIYIGLSIGWPKEEWKAALGLRKPKIKPLLLAALTGMALYFVLQWAATAMADNGYPIESSETSTTLGVLTGFTRILIFYIMSPVIVPIIEELFFRGWVLSAFLGSNIPKSFRVPVAIFASAFTFALMHVQGFSTTSDFFIPVWIFFMALIQAGFMLRYKSIWVPITLHIFYNGITVIMSTLAH